MVKFLTTTVLLILATYFGLCALLYIMQRKLMYFPTASVKSSEAEVLWLKSDNETLKVWRIAEGSERALIYFGGNAEDVALNIPEFMTLYPDHSIYLLNYRGYGGSSGTPTEKGLLEDALTLYDHVKEHHDKITVMGRSLGTGVAISLAANRTIHKLILVTPYDSMVNVASSIYPFIPVSLLLRDQYDSLNYAQDVTAETLILIAEHDEVIPRKRSENLAMAFNPESVRVEIIRGTGHNTISTSPRYDLAITAFITK